MSNTDEVKIVCEVCGTKSAKKYVMIDNKKVCKDCAKKLIENIDEDDGIKESIDQPQEQVIEKKKDEKRNKTFLIGTITVIVGIIIICIFFGVLAREQNDSRYTQGIDLIKVGKYSDASGLLLNMEYKNSKVLYNYANAQIKRTTDVLAAESFLNKIPNSYSGEFADEIKALKESVKETINQQKQQQAEQKKQQEQAKREKIRSSILISKVSTDNPNSAGGVNFRVVWKNTSDKVIKYCFFTVVPYNAVGDIVSCTIRHESEYTGKVTGPIAPGQWYGEGKYWDCAWYNNSIVKAKLKKVVINYMDGTSIQIEGNDIDSVQA